MQIDADRCRSMQIDARRERGRAPLANFAFDQEPRARQLPLEYGAALSETMR
jgi:hypothetical protein